MKTDKPSEFILTNNSAVKEETLWFKKHDKKSYSNLVTIINKLQEYEHVHIQVRITSASPEEVKNGLSLKEFTVMDDRKIV